MDKFWRLKPFLMNAFSEKTLLKILKFFTNIADLNFSFRNESNNSLK